MKLAQIFLELIERKPSVGYALAMMPTLASGQMFFQKLNAVLAFLSLVAGLSVATITFYVQFLNVKKLRRESKNNNDKQQT